MDSKEEIVSLVQKSVSTLSLMEKYDAQLKDLKRCNIVKRNIALQCINDTELEWQERIAKLKTEAVQQLHSTVRRRRRELSRKQTVLRKANDELFAILQEAKALMSEKKVNPILWENIKRRFSKLSEENFAVASSDYNYLEFVPEHPDDITLGFLRKNVREYDPRHIKLCDLSGNNPAIEVEGFVVLRLCVQEEDVCKDLLNMMPEFLVDVVGPDKKALKSQFWVQNLQLHLTFQAHEVGTHVVDVQLCGRSISSCPLTILVVPKELGPKLVPHHADCRHENSTEAVSHRVSPTASDDEASSDVSDDEPPELFNQTVSLGGAKARSSELGSVWREYHESPMSWSSISPQSITSMPPTDSKPLKYQDNTSDAPMIKYKEVMDNDGWNETDSATEADSQTTPDTSVFIEERGLAEADSCEDNNIRKQNFNASTVSGGDRLEKVNETEVGSTNESNTALQINPLIMLEEAEENDGGVDSKHGPHTTVTLPIRDDVHVPGSTTKQNEMSIDASPPINRDEQCELHVGERTQPILASSHTTFKNSASSTGDPDESEDVVIQRDAVLYSLANQSSDDSWSELAEKSPVRSRSKASGGGAEGCESLEAIPKRQDISKELLLEAHKSKRDSTEKPDNVPDLGSGNHLTVLMQLLQGKDLPARRILPLDEGDHLWSFRFPIGVTATAVSENRCIIACDTGNHMVKVLTWGGKIKFTIPASNAVARFQRPSAVVVSTDGDIFVKDDHFIHAFSPLGTFLREIGKDILSRPYGLCLMKNDHLVTLDHRAGTVFIFSQMGDVLRRLPFPPLQWYQGNCKFRFIAAHDHVMAAVDLGQNRVVLMCLKSGQVLHQFGQTGHLPGQFSEPAGITVDTDGNFFIADSKNNRIQVFDLKGTFKCRVGINGLHRPSDIHLTKDNYLLVNNYLHHCIKVYLIG